MEHVKEFNKDKKYGLQKVVDSRRLSSQPRRDSSPMHSTQYFTGEQRPDVSSSMAEKDLTGGKHRTTLDRQESLKKIKLRLLKNLSNCRNAIAKSQLDIYNLDTAAASNSTTKLIPQPASNHPKPPANIGLIERPQSKSKKPE